MNRIRLASAAPASGLAAPASGLAAPASGLAAPASGLAAPAAGLVAVALLLTGCTSALDDAAASAGHDVAPAPAADDGAPDPTEHDAAGATDGAGTDGTGEETGGDAAARFLACVVEAGFEGFLDEWGNVRVVDDFAQQLLNSRLAHGASTGPSDTADPSWRDPRTHYAHIFGQADDGRAVAAPTSAAYFSEDPVAAAAWAGCEAAHPDHVQPGIVVDEGAHAERLAAAQRDALAFARSARDAGHHWVADPMPGSPLILLPAGLTEAALRAALTDALDPGVWLSFDTLEDLGFDWRSVVGEFVGAGLG